MNFSKFYFFVIILFIYKFSFSQLIFDDNFDNGHVELLGINGDIYEIDPSSYLHFRIIGVKGESPKFFTQQKKDYIFKNSHKMVFKYEGEDIWNYMDTGYIDINKNYFFHNYQSFKHDTVYIAYWYPWTFKQMVDYMKSISGLPYVRNNNVKAMSLQQRPIYGYEITDTAVNDSLKQHIILIARQHAQESLGSHIARGISDYLINSNDPIATSLRRKIIFHFYPMINPDGVSCGGNPVCQTDHNDSWLHGVPSNGGKLSENHEINIMRDIIWKETGGFAKYAIDIHSHPGYSGNFYWWGPLSGPTNEKVQTAIDLVKKISYYDALSHNGNAVINNFISSDSWDWSGPWADYWLSETLGAIAFTFETGFISQETTLHRITQAGIAICKGLNDFIPEPEIPLIVSELSNFNILVKPNPK